MILRRNCDGNLFEVRFLIGGAFLKIKMFFKIWRPLFKIKISLSFLRYGWYFYQDQIPNFLKINRTFFDLSEIFKIWWYFLISFVHTFEDNSLFIDHVKLLIATFSFLRWDHFTLLFGAQFLDTTLPKIFKIKADTSLSLKNQIVVTKAQAPTFRAQP